MVRRAGDSRPLVRRDADGAASSATSWESLTERLIREAQDEGAFDALRGHGQPLDLDDDVFSGDMSVAYHILGNARIAPAWIEADKRIRQLRAEIRSIIERGHVTRGAARTRTRRRLVGLLAEETMAVRQLENLAPTARQHRTPMDADETLAAFDATAAGAT